MDKTMVRMGDRFVTFKHASPKTTSELVAHFEDNMKAQEHFASSN
jgi:hypothetical protein